MTSGFFLVLMFVSMIFMPAAAVFAFIGWLAFGATGALICFGIGLMIDAA